MNCKVLITSVLLIGLFLPVGVFASDDEEYSQGTIFKTPKFLIDKMDEDYKDMSNLDYWGTKSQEPTKAPPTFQSYVNEGWAYLEGGSNRDAEKSFEKAIQMNSTSCEAWYGKGLALENQKRYLSAVDAFSQSLSFSKKAVDKWGSNAGLGRTYLSIQQYEKAKEACNLAISQYEQAGESSPDEIASIYQTLAKALEALGEVDAAQDALNKASDI